MNGLPPHPGMPRWVKVGVLALLVLLLVVVLHLTGRGFRGHGPASTVTALRSYCS
jgi:ABC-type transporter Mla subunit MlaD